MTEQTAPWIPAFEGLLPYLVITLAVLLTIGGVYAVFKEFCRQYGKPHLRSGKPYRND